MRLAASAESDLALGMVLHPRALTTRAAEGERAAVAELDYEFYERARAASRAIWAFYLSDPMHWLALLHSLGPRTGERSWDMRAMAYWNEEWPKWAAYE